MSNWTKLRIAVGNAILPSDDDLAQTQVNQSRL